MGTPVKWQDDLNAIAWINISLIVMSLPLFSIYIVQSVQGENADFLMHTERGRHFVEVIAKYIASVAFWTPISILLKIGATKTSCTLIKSCSAGYLVFIFLLALQLILEPPVSILVVCAYGISFLYLLATVLIMKNFMEELQDLKDELDPAVSSDSISNNDNFDELNDVADQRTVFRLQHLSKNALKTKL